MQPGHRRRILQGRHASSHDFDAQSVYVRNFADYYHADLKKSFDFVFMEISPGFFEPTVDELDPPDIRTQTRLRALDHVTSINLVLRALATALVSALERPNSEIALFFEQMGVVIWRPPRRNLWRQCNGSNEKTRGLSHLHEARSKKILCNLIDDEILIAKAA